MIVAWSNSNWARLEKLKCYGHIAVFQPVALFRSLSGSTLSSKTTNHEFLNTVNIMAETNKLPQSKAG